MTDQEKKKRLTELNETELRREIIIPLLKAIGYSDVYEFHSTQEKGKDIIFREINRLKEIFIYAAVVSTDNITGKVGDDRSSSRILEQVEKALNEPFPDKYTGKILNIDRCWVITSGNIISTAIDSIIGKLEKYNLNRLIKFVDCSKLIELLDEFYPQYWERNKEIVYYSPVKAIDISTNKLDKPYDKEVDDLPAAGSLKDTVYRIKKNIYSLILNCEYDLIKRLIEIIECNNPKKILQLWEDLSGDIINKGRYFYLGDYPDKIQSDWNYLLDDVQEYEKRFNIKA